MSAWPKPPPYSLVGKHAVFPQTSHDERARFNFLAQLNTHLATHVLPANKLAYERRAAPAWEEAHGQPPQSRHQVRQAMLSDPLFQTWSALRRGSMELRQQAGRQVVLRQLEELNRSAAQLNQGSEQLLLDPDMPLPGYIAQVDHHCMPGGYVTEQCADDVSAAANYDVGIFATTAGGLGRYSDGAGNAVAQWLHKMHPQRQPKRILDLGCGMGHSLLPVAQAYPDAQVVAIDVAAPMLRYAHARARSLGVNNVRFVQANAELIDAPDQSFDIVYSTMFLHETSAKAIKRVLAESYRLLASGGISFHLEQPQYGGLPLFEQFMREWDAHYNNEPFWGRMHELDLRKLLQQAGFDDANIFEDRAEAVVDEAVFGKPDASVEDYGRKALWHLIGAGR